MQLSEMLGAERVKIFCESNNVIFAFLVSDTVNSVMKKENKTLFKTKHFCLMSISSMER